MLRLQFSGRALLSSHKPRPCWPVSAGSYTAPQAIRAGYLIQAMPKVCHLPLQEVAPCVRSTVRPCTQAAWPRQLRQMRPATAGGRAAPALQRSCGAGPAARGEGIGLRCQAQPSAPARHQGAGLDNCARGLQRQVGQDSRPQLTAPGLVNLSWTILSRQQRPACRFFTAQLLLMFMHNHCKWVATLMPRSALLKIGTSVTRLFQ